MSSPSLIQQADSALGLAREEPERAMALAEELRRQAVAEGNPQVETRALRALGLAARAERRLTDAVEWLRRAVEAAEAADELDLGAEARVSLASCLAFTGDPQAALEALEGARSSDGIAAVVASNRAGILTMLGRYDEALQGYGPAVEVFRRQGEGLREGRALSNRGLLFVYTGRFRQAEIDLARAEELLLGQGLGVEAAGARHNRGFAAARRGDLPAALALFDEAEQRYLQAGVPVGPLALDKAEVLLAAGLVNDALGAVRAALEHLQRSGNQAGRAEGLLLLADVSHLAGDGAGSGAAARQAAELFVEQDRPTWAALAHSALGRAALTAGETGTDAAVLAAAAAVELDRAGLGAQAVDAHACAGELWLLGGARQAAESELAAASAGRRLGTARARAAAWEAEGVRRLAAGDRRGALAALRSGLDVVAAQQASLGASELRAYVAVHAERTAARGLRLVVDHGRPRQILAWMERRRANALRSWPLRPPPGQPLSGWLDELRTLSRQIEEGAVKGADVGSLLRRQTIVERLVRERAWVARPSEPGPPAAARFRLPRDPAITDLRRIDQVLGERALVELASSDGMLHAVVVAGGRCWHRPIGEMSVVSRELEHLRFALRRSAYGLAGRERVTGSGAPGAGAGRPLGADLDALLFGPLHRLIGSRPVVIVPTGELHAIPWATLPSLAGRPMAVAPSAGAWMRAVTTSAAVAARDTSVLVVAGPGLEWARPEAGALRAIHPSATVLEGAQATAGAVVAELQRCGIAHIAAHARFRADNGLWSALELADGPLSVYELEGLQRAPGLVVLSACQSGLSTVRSGDELLGLVSALLALGTSTVIASVVPVPDGPTMALMVDLHRALAGGLAPATALAAAQGAAATWAAAASFVCFGAG